MTQVERVQLLAVQELLSNQSIEAYQDTLAHMMYLIGTGKNHDEEAVECSYLLYGFFSFLRKARQVPPTQ
ncbi:MAG: hypothetical protein AAGI23_09330 [Bacteroidota bacterium]